MKKPGVLIRSLCGLVDFLIIMIPIQFIMLGVFRVSVSQADLFFQLLFAVYGTLAVEYMEMTVGKYFGKLRLMDVNGGKPVMMYVGIRELAKSFYFVPYIGWAAAGVSFVMMLVRKDGRTLHDLIGNTRVLYSWQAQRIREETEYADK